MVRIKKSCLIITQAIYGAIIFLNTAVKYNVLRPYFEHGFNHLLHSHSGEPDILQKGHFQTSTAEPL